MLTVTPYLCDYLPLEGELLHAAQWLSPMGFSVVHVNVISLIILRIVFKVVSSTVLPHNDTDYMYQAQQFNHFCLFQGIQSGCLDYANQMLTH